MARRRTGPGPGYDGPEYDPVYGPAFDSSLGRPVTPPLLRRTRPPDPRRTRVVVAAVVVAVLIVVATAVYAIRMGGDDGGDGAVAPPSPTVVDARGQSAQLVETLTANGFECAAQFGTADGARRGCFATRADTVLTAAVFEDDRSGAVTAIRLDARELSGSKLMRPRTLAAVDELVRVFAPVVFPADQERAQAGLRKQSLTIVGEWGRFRFVNTGGQVELRADRTGRRPLTPVTPVFATPRKDLIDSLARMGWACAAICTKTGRATIRPEGADRISGIAMTVDGDRNAFDAQVAALFEVLQGDATGELREWIADRRERGPGSGFVRGWRVWVETRYAAGRRAGYGLRVSPQPVLSTVS